MKLSDLKSGDVVKVDDGFTCISAFTERRVHADENGQLYVTCQMGRHYLDGQENADGDLIGIMGTTS